ncbi:MAG: TorF family putative porin [Pontixanthobacter sp.]
MLTSIRGLCAVSIAAYAAITSTTAFAQASPVASQDVDPPSETAGPLTVSANVTLASEYRFRGVDLSGGDFAIQGGVDAVHESGFYVGTWASSLDEDTVGYGSTELDIYGGWGGNLAEGLTTDVGVIAYLYPDAGPGDFDYVEFYGSLTFAIGPAEATAGVAYAPEQESLGGTGNVYVYTDVGFAIPDTPVSITGHVGYTDGFLTFTDDGDAFDWSIGAEAAIAGTPLTVGAAYVDAEGDIAQGAYDFTDEAFVFTLGANF